MKIIAVANQKGGCAKTTTVVNLAACLAEQNKKVLVIDLDSQANATSWLGADNQSLGAIRLLTTKDALEKLILPSCVEGVFIIAASRELANFEKVVAVAVAGVNPPKSRLTGLDSND